MEELQNKNLWVSVSPHIQAKSSVASIMWKVVFALVPALLGSVYFFGLRSLLVVGVCIIASMLSEYIVQLFRKQPSSLDDGSAVLTGLLIAFNLPVTIPVWMAAFGCIFAVVIVKHLFGGLGNNILNPALAGRAFLLAAYPVEMTTWVKPGSLTVTGATPLAIVKESLDVSIPSYMDMFIGNIGGCLGETSAMLLLLGALYLLFTRVITVYIPFSYIGTVVLLSFVFGGPSLFTGDVLFHLLSGGLMLGAFYMATDMVTSPITNKGCVFFGIGCGILTVSIRLWGGYPEGVSYSILIMNLCVPLIDRYVKPRVYGTKLKTD